MFVSLKINNQNSLLTQGYKPHFNSELSKKTPTNLNKLNSNYKKNQTGLDYKHTSISETNENILSTTNMSMNYSTNDLSSNSFVSNQNNSKLNKTFNGSNNNVYFIADKFKLTNKKTMSNRQNDTKSIVKSEQNNLTFPQVKQVESNYFF